MIPRQMLMKAVIHPAWFRFGLDVRRVSRKKSAPMSIRITPLTLRTPSAFASSGSWGSTIWKEITPSINIREYQSKLSPMYT